MRLCLIAFVLVATGTITPPSATAWSISKSRSTRSTHFGSIEFCRGRKLSMVKDPQEFDSLLVEGGKSATPPPRRRLILLGGDENKALLTSTTTFPGGVQDSYEEQIAQQQSNSEQGTAGDQEGIVADEYDPYGDLDSQINMVQQYEDRQLNPNSLESRLKNMDFQDVVVTLFIPAVIAFAGIRWTFNRVYDRLEDKADSLLESFANEMVFHDGDFEEMKMCYADYKRRLLWMGPKKGDTMIKRYLEAYAKKKTVSPQSISSLSYVFTLFKLSEAKAAQILVSLCRQMGSDKISSAGKLLFFGSRILKSKEGKAALLPIKEMIMSTYRDEAVAATLVETSQQAMGEAAYRTTVQAGGKNQKTLTIGWEVLGLTKEAATRIFEEEAKENFISAREAMYGGQKQKYDKKGRKIGEDGNLENPEEADDDEESNEEEATSNVYTCTDCGYTLFVAQGRESKFFGEGFKCPECGAPKDKFKAGLEDDD